MRSKGFTLIELLIVVAIILIIGAIAIPNLMDSRMSSNESAAIDRLRNYEEAQRRFKREGYGRNPANLAPVADGYAANFRMLHYGAKADANASGGASSLELINKAHADAFIADAPLSGVGPGGKPYGAAASYNGYYFMDPTGFPDGTTARDFFATGYAHVAVPELANSTGNSMFFLGADGVIWRRLLGNGVSCAEASTYATPLTDPTGWEPYF